MRYLSAHTVTSGFFFTLLSSAVYLYWSSWNFAVCCDILDPGVAKDKDRKMMATRNPKVSPKRKVSKPKAHESSLSKDQGEVELRLHGERVFYVWLFALVLL